ncbi:MAG: 5-(carboxyamino)imidazole ribonucleotide synthase [Rhodospirillaceae bacterium]|nr:5-(carboxyamino)imidazole ribonucleotide synthase [Rhodospirillaceae bacterium]
MSGEQGQRIAPGGTIGILGGGQLGRMTAMAAARLGYRSHIFCPERDTPASHVAAATTVAAYEDRIALDTFADAVDVVTIEFENVPSTSAEYLATLKPFRPSPRVLEITQDRLKEKDYLVSINVPTTKYMEVARADGLERAVRNIGRPSVLKTVRLGYDGKGQVAIGTDTDLKDAWKRMGGNLGILEGYVDFALEISVIVARDLDGNVVAYPPVENIHRNHILDATIVPARIESAVMMKAEAIARHIAEQIGLLGLLAVEMFVTAKGEVLVNELAPRPHNSGHWTIDACMTSQFEQFVRAVCGLPLGAIDRHSNAVMKNLIGDEVDTWREIIAEPAAKLHLYGKKESRPGRKMGHVTRLSPKQQN